MDKIEMIYKFYDRDSTGLIDYDIEDDIYRKLIDRCFEYCKVVSFTFENSAHEYELEKRMESFRIESNIIPSLSPRYYKLENGRRKYYRLCIEMKAILLEAKSMFEWIDGWGFHNPTDPTFYRKDGSVFFDSMIHEGECVLIPRKDENLFEILEAIPWITPESHAFNPKYQSGFNQGIQSQSGDGSVIDHA